MYSSSSWESVHEAYRVAVMMLLFIHATIVLLFIHAAIVFQYSLILVLQRLG